MNFFGMPWVSEIQSPFMGSASSVAALASSEAALSA
jgi:hypothetical protein